MTDEQASIDDISIEREGGSVRIRIERNDGDDELMYLPPDQAVQVAMWMQQAAADAKQWQQHEGAR